MKRKIPCFCDNVFDVEVPDEINLDSEPKYLEEIFNGSFLNFNCPSCGKKHKPEFPLTILWPSKALCFEILPELDRGEFYRRKEVPLKKEPFTLETIIVYPEIADRLAVIRDGYEPIAIEAIKYHLQVKAEEQYPDNEIEIWYFGSKPEASSGYLEFHIHGIKENEVAVSKIPLALYEKTLSDYKKQPKSEIFTILRVKSYLSIKNTMRLETLK